MNPDQLPPELAIPAAVILTALYLLTGAKDHR